MGHNTCIGPYTSRGEHVKIAKMEGHRVEANELIRLPRGVAIDHVEICSSPKIRRVRGIGVGDPSAREAELLIVCTGQHYEYAMSRLFFNE